MKTIAVFVLCALLHSEAFSAGYEVIFHLRGFPTGQSATIRAQLSGNGYSLSSSGGSQRIVPIFSFDDTIQLPGTKYGWDSPDNQDHSGEAPIPWGGIQFTVQWFTRVKHFDISFLDERWSGDSETYPSHDTHIYIDWANDSLFFVIVDGNPEQALSFEAGYSIASLWDASDPVTGNFGQAIKLSNYSGTENIGDLLKLGTTNVPSGEYGVAAAGASSAAISTAIERKTVNDTVFKHHDWNESAIRNTLSDAIVPTPGNSIQDAHFLALDPVSLGSTLLENTGLTSSVQFLDPWYLNAQGQQTGQEWLTVSSSNPPRGAYGQSTGGVFLNQNLTFDPAKPVYSLKSPSTQSDMSGFTGCFFRWDYSDATVQNANSPDSQGVVFTHPNAVVTAIYKAHLGSNVSSVSASGGARRHAIGSGSYNVHAVYESAGEVWHTRQVNANSWLPEKRVSAGTGGNSNPSVAIDEDGVILFAVWERQSGSTRTILASRCSSDVWQSPVTVASYSENSSFASRPVIGFHYGQPSSILWVAYARSNGWIYLSNSTNNGSNWTSNGCYAGVKPSLENNWSSLPLAFLEDDEVYLTTCEWESEQELEKALGKTTEDPPEYYEVWQNPVLLTASTEAFYSGQWNEGELIWNQCLDPQVSYNGSRMHATWLQNQMYLIDDFAADVKYLVHQSRDAYGNLSAGTAWQFEYWEDVSNPTIDRVPRIAASVGGTLAYTLGDQNGSWSTWDSFGSGSNPTFSLSASSTSQYLMSTTEGSLYHINPGTISLAKSTRNDVEYDCARVIVAVDTSTGEQFSIRMSEPVISGRKVPFAAINDTLPGITSRNFLDFLATVPASIQSDADTVSFSLVVSGKTKRQMDISLSSGVESGSMTLGTLSSIEASLSKMTTHHSVKSVLRGLKGRSVSLKAAGGLKEELGLNWVFSVVHVYDTRKDKSAPAIDAPLTEMTAALPEKLSLTTYPNPFNPETNIAVQLPVISEIDLRVYDMLGREVMVLSSGMKEAGTHMFTFNGARLGSGVYFCRLIAKSDGGKPIQHTLKLALQK